MENTYRRWQELQEQVRYIKKNRETQIEYHAFKGDTHIATIVVWAHKVNKSCMLLWLETNKSSQRCGSLDEAKRIVEE